MNLIEFIYRILERFAPIGGKKLIQLEAEASDWYREKIGDEKNKVGSIIREYGETWWFKTALAVLFIFMVREIGDYMNGTNKIEKDDDND